MKTLKTASSLLIILFLFPHFLFSQSEKSLDVFFSLMENSITKGTYNSEVQKLLAFYDTDKEKIDKEKIDRAFQIKKTFIPAQMNTKFYTQVQIIRHNDKDGINRIDLKNYPSHQKEYEPFKGTIYGIELEKAVNYDDFYEQLKGRSDLIVSKKKEKNLNEEEAIVIYKKELNYKVIFYFWNKKEKNIKDSNKRGKYLLSQISFYIDIDDFFVEIEKDYKEFKYKENPDLAKYTKLTEEYYAEMLPKLLKGSELEGQTNFDKIPKLKSFFGTDNVQEIIQKAKQFPNYSYEKAANSSNRHHLTVFCFDLTIYNEFGVTANPKKVKSIEVRKNDFFDDTYQKEITKEIYAEYFGVPSLHRQNAQNSTFKGWYFMAGECLTGDCENGWGTYKARDFTYTGSFLNGQAYGQGKVEENGNNYEGIFKAGKYTGKGKLNTIDVEWKNGQLQQAEIPYEGGTFVGTTDENLQPKTGKATINNEKNGNQLIIDFEEGIVKENKILYSDKTILTLQVIDGKIDFQNATIDYPEKITYKGEVDSKFYQPDGKGQLSKDTENLMFGQSYLTIKKALALFSTQDVYDTLRNSLPLYIDAFFIKNQIDYSKSVFFTQAERKLEVRGIPNAKPSAEIKINGTNLKTTYQNYEDKTITIVGNWEDNFPVGTHKVDYEGKTYTSLYDKGEIVKGIDFYAPDYKNDNSEDKDFALTKKEIKDKLQIGKDKEYEIRAEKRREYERKQWIKAHPNATPLFADPQKKN